MSNNQPIITLITDFGLSDEYAGVMKGVLLSHCPSAQLVDICHMVPPHNIIHGSRILSSSYAYFPKNTVHLVVVDPGVGGTRHIIVVESGAHIFVGPDNGVLSPALRSSELKKCYRVKNKDAPCPTFHGRDIMAPIAGKLAAGASASDFGTEVSPQDCIALPSPVCFLDENSITGEVVAVDHFGNVATSISAVDVYSLIGTLTITVRNTAVTGLAKTYSDVAKGELVALIDSRGFLEIGLNHGSAAKVLNCKPGEKVQVTAAGR